MILRKDKCHEFITTLPERKPTLRRTDNIVAVTCTVH